MSTQYVAERRTGSRSNPRKSRDWEVLDTIRIAGNRVMCRANRKDAILIAEALNLAALGLRDAAE